LIDELIVSYSFLATENIIENEEITMILCTVKPVYNGHSR